MPFDNENTYVKMVMSGKEEEFHQKYEKKLEDVVEYFGKEYPNLLLEEVFEEQKFTKISPIDGKTEIGKFQMSSKENSEKAAEFSRAGYRAWYKKGYIYRAETFLRAADALASRKYDFAAMLTYENGKNRYESFADVDEAIDFMRYYALQLLKNEGYVKLTGGVTLGEESKSVMKPYGLFLVIAPFNYFSITVGMMSGPLITGNSVILKPSSDIPLCSYLVVKLLHEVGVPKENLMFLSGSGKMVGKTLYTNNNIDGIVFTGSRDVGMKIYMESQEIRPKVLVTEMGGKDTVIVTKNADLSMAAEGTAKAAFGYSGQKCSACSLVLVHESVYNKFKKRLVEYSKELTIGDPRERKTYAGPIINKEAYEKFKKIVSIVPKEAILLGGNVIERGGYYLENTIFDNVNIPEIERVELFLPVLSLKPFRELKEAINLVNSMDYGLTGGIFSEDKKEVEEYFELVDVGVVYANRRSGGSTGAVVASQPFVGWKMSGTTGKGTGSFYYLQQFLREQSQTVNTN